MGVVGLAQGLYLFFLYKIYTPTMCTTNDVVRRTIALRTIGRGASRAGLGRLRRFHGGCGLTGPGTSRGRLGSARVTIGVLVLRHAKSCTMAKTSL